jgi:Zn-dependent peptidase ImmA (M78 family)
MIAIFPELAAAAAAGDAERLAILVRRYFGGPETHAPRPDVERLALEAGITVERLPLDAHGALLAKDEKGRFTIVAVIPAGADAQTARFVLAHQLGHYFLDIQTLIARGDWQVSGYREVVNPLKRYAGHVEEAPTKMPAQQRELKADQFAAALLLPRGMVRRALERIGDADRVAAFFGVTRACLARRMADLGLSARAPVSFLDAESLAGRTGAEADAGSGPVDVGTDGGASLRAPAATRGGSVPRAVAASSYGSGAAGKPPSASEPAASGKTAPSKSAPATPSQAPSTAASDAAPPSAPRQAPAAAGGGIGMERLREIARKLDKGAGR